MKIYDTIKTYSTPEAARKEFEAAMKQWETERVAAQAAKAAADAKATYASHLTEIANRMLNHTETAEDVAFIVNTYLTDKLGPQDDGDPYLTADGINSVLECLSALKNLTIPGKATASHSRSDDETISKFLDDILGL